MCNGQLRPLTASRKLSRASSEVILTFLSATTPRRRVRTSLRWSGRCELRRPAPPPRNPKPVKLNFYRHQCGHGPFRSPLRAHGDYLPRSRIRILQLPGQYGTSESGQWDGSATGVETIRSAYIQLANRQIPETTVDAIKRCEASQSKTSESLIDYLYNLTVVILWADSFRKSKPCGYHQNNAGV